MPCLPRPSARASVTSTGAYIAPYTGRLEKPTAVGCVCEREGERAGEEGEGALGALAEEAHGHKRTESVLVQSDSGSLLVVSLAKRNRPLNKELEKEEGTGFAPGV